jgi:hypothetical protein
MAVNEAFIQELIADGRLPEDMPNIAPSEAAVEAARIAFDIIKHNLPSYVGHDGGVAEAVALNLVNDPADKQGIALKLLTQFFSLPENEAKIRPVAEIMVEAETATASTLPAQPLTATQKLLQTGLKDKYSSPKLPSYGGFDTPG